MSISNYGELKTAVANHVARSDLTSVIPDFITMVQAYIHHGDHEMGLDATRIKAMLNTETLTISSGTATAPSGMLEVLSVHIPNAVPVQLEYVPLSDWNSWQFVTSEDVPVWYTLEGDTFRFQPKGATSATLSYWKTLTALSDDTDTDWFITNAPQVYLWGALALAFAYVMEEQRAQMYRGMFVSALKGIQKSHADRDYAGGALAMQPRAFA